MRTFMTLLLALAIVNVGRSDTFAYVSLAKEKKVAVFKVDTQSGSLTHVSDAPCGGEPAALVVSPAKTSLFVSLRPEGKLVAFRIDRTSGGLTHINTVDA